MSQACPAHVILQFIINQIHEGHFERVLDLGLTWEQIRLLESLAGRDLHYLFEAAAHFVSLQIVIDPHQSEVVIRRLREQQQLRETQQALLRAGAPRQLMIQLYGWNADHYWKQRRFLGLGQDHPRGGRPANPSRRQEAQILRAWDQFTDRPLGERYLETARAAGVSVRQVHRLLEVLAAPDPEAPPAPAPAVRPGPPAYRSRPTPPGMRDAH